MPDSLTAPLRPSAKELDAHCDEVTPRRRRTEVKTLLRRGSDFPQADIPQRLHQQLLERMEHAKN